MKKSLTIIALAALVMLAGCKKNDPKPNGTRLIAGIEQQKSDSKTSLDGLQIKWSEGDKLYVNNGTTDPACFTLVSGAGTTTGEFATTGDYPFANENNLAVYPYNDNITVSGTTVTMTLPAVQTASGSGSFGNNANPMMGTFSDMDNLTLTSLCGVLCLQLTGDNVAITAIEIVGGPDDKLNGTFTVDYMNPVLTYSANGTNSVRLNCEATLTLEAQKFYVVVPAGTLHGFTMKVYDGNNEIFSKSTANEVPVFVNTLSTMTPVEVVPFNPLATPLTIEAIEAGATVRLTLSSQAGATMEYSTDGTNWSSYTSYNPITLTNAGDKVMFRAPVSGNTRLGYQQNYYGTYVVNGSKFSIDKNCYVYGNVMSLLYQDFFDKTSFPEGSQYTMPSLFSGCGKLYNHSGKAIILPATTLAVSCYESMFNNCTNLTTIPELPATTLAEGCYKSMFNGCKGLTSIPSDLLPITTLAESCYQSMFNGCSGLTTIPGDLLPATTLKNNCYQNMFTNCTGLTSIPENLLQSVTTLANYCYASMFSSCSGLTSVPDDLLPITTLAPYCYQYMFTNCTGLTTAPDLPAAELVSSCYYYMFQNCSNLHSIKCLATSGINENQSTYNWMKNVASSGTFTKAAGASWPTGPGGIPSGWITYKFSVSATQAVQFAPGNLQYKSGEGWRFAEHQYDYIGAWNATDWVDYFGWGTWGDGQNPLQTVKSSSSYHWSTDFQGTLNGHNDWYTLTKDEWNYLFTGRTNASSLYGHATVNGVHGIIVLPDASTLSINSTSHNWSANVIDATTWTNTYEADGAMFLPAAGQRYGTDVEDVNSYGYYWSSTTAFGNNAYELLISSLIVSAASNTDNYYYGNSVRLARIVQQ